MLIRDLIEVRDFPAVVQAADVRSMRDRALQLRLRDAANAPALDAPDLAPPLDDVARDFIGGYLGFDERARFALEASITSLGTARGGAWFLNGVFGSGKSHLLGLLALLCDGAGHDVFRLSHAPLSVPLRHFTPRLVVHFSLDEYRASHHALEDIFWREVRNEWQRHNFDARELPDPISAAPKIDADRASASTSSDSTSSDSTSSVATANVSTPASPIASTTSAIASTTSAIASTTSAIASTASRSEIFAAMEDALRARGLHGMVVCIDELSLFLSGREHRALQNDATFLQFLGQRARRSSMAANNHKAANNASSRGMSTHAGARTTVSDAAGVAASRMSTHARACPLWIFAALQKTVEDIGDLDSYALSQIRDRFTTLPLSLAHLPSLIERRLIARRDEDALNRFCDASYAALLGALPRLDFGREEWARLYPFHPATIALLEQVVARYGSRTRSAALFCAHSVKAENEAGQRVSLDALFSYIEPELGAHPDLRPLATVWKQWRDDAPERGAHDDENARMDSLMRALLLWKIAGAAPSIAQLVNATALDARLPGDGNYEYGRILLEKMRLWGPIVVERREGAFADRYAIDLGTRVGEMMRRFTANALHTLPPRDGRIARHARSCCREETLPLASMQEAASTTVMWRNSARQVRIEVLDAPPDAATLANRLAALCSLAAPDDLALFIVPPFCSRFDANPKAAPHMSTHAADENEDGADAEVVNAEVVDAESFDDDEEEFVEELVEEFEVETELEASHRKWREAMRAAWMAMQNGALTQNAALDATSRGGDDAAAREAVSIGSETRWRGAVLWWLPREASPDEWQQARETTAQHLLKHDPQLADNRRGRAVLEHLKQGEASREAALGRIGARLLFEGQIATGAGASVDAADLAGRDSWGATLEALAEFALPSVFPRFASLAPQLRVSTPANSDALCLDILRRPVASPFFAASLGRVARALAEPLGVARESGGRWKINAPREDLAQDIMRRVGNGALLAAIEAALAKSQWGLPGETSRIAICALLRSGDLAAFDARGARLSPSTIGLPLRREVHTLRPGRLMDPSAWNRLGTLIALLTQRETLGAPSFAEQERAAALLCAWRDDARAQTELAQARLHQWRKLAASPSRWPRIDAAWETITSSLHALENRGASGETLERAARIDPEPLPDALHTWRETVHKLDGRHAALLESHTRLRHPDLVAPTEMQSAQAALLARFAVGEGVLDDETLLQDAARWLHEYSTRYQAWHQAQNAAPRFIPYRRLLASNQLHALNRLETVRSRAWPQGEAARTSIAEQLARQCLSDGQVRGESVCASCRLRLDARLTLRDPREIEALVQSGIASFRAALQEVAPHEYLKRFSQCEPLLEWSQRQGDEANSEGAQSEGAQTDDALLPLLSDEVLEALGEAFRPRRRVARSWTALRQATASCRTRSEWQRAFALWLDGDDAPGEEDEIELSD